MTDLLTPHLRPVRQLDFGVLLVNNNLTRDLTLVNNSDSDIRYELLYVAYPGATGGDEASSTSTGMHVVPMLPSSKEHALVVNLPSGILPARSKTITRVSQTDHTHNTRHRDLTTTELGMHDICTVFLCLYQVTFQPNQARNYSFGIVANLRTVDQDGNEVRTSRLVRITHTL